MSQIFLSTHIAHIQLWDSTMLNSGEPLQFNALRHHGVHTFIYHMPFVKPLFGLSKVASICYHGRSNKVTPKTTI